MNLDDKSLDESEQNIYKQYLEQFESIIEDSLFGGKVHTFLKNSSDPLQINLSDSVSGLINNGVSLMTFFGHAYGQNFDQSIDDPENYQNTSKIQLFKKMIFLTMIISS